MTTTDTPTTSDNAADERRPADFRAAAAELATRWTAARINPSHIYPSEARVYGDGMENGLDRAADDIRDALAAYPEIPDTAVKVAALREAAAQQRAEAAVAATKQGKWEGEGIADVLDQHADALAKASVNTAVVETSIRYRVQFLHASEGWMDLTGDHTDYLDAIRIVAYHAVTAPDRRCQIIAVTTTTTAVAMPFEARQV